ncbi:MAG TPA: hypothetical protein VEH84_19040 [Alphaproteobacteria bacterium]|nr:hypothetical protein [Alphaproteobacteria bacterium]
MTDTAPLPKPPLDRLVAALRGVAADAAAAVERDEPVDLSGLDTQVRGLCERLAAVDRAEAEALLPALDELEAVLAGLGERLNARAAALAGRDPASLRRAADLYGKAP